MDEIGHLVREISRLIVRRGAHLNPVLRAIRTQSSFKALEALGSSTKAAEALGVSRSTLWRLRRGRPDPEGRMDGRRR